MTIPAEAGVERPMGLLAELTHRCPLQCPYCSNPLALEGATGEIATADWIRVFEEAARLGVLQLHLSGGEPTARKDLGALVDAARRLDLYTNLITSGVLLDQAMTADLAGRGLDHVQLSFQDVDPVNADRIGGFKGGHSRKLEAAALIKAAGLPLTLNFVVHRQNLERLPGMIALAVELGAARVEIAHTQYYGWGLENRAALLPSRVQLDAATAEVDAARIRLKGRLLIDYVTPDYYARRPKACMSGWGRRFITITPSGKALPCHAAATLPGIAVPSVMEQPLDRIWFQSEMFGKFRGVAWMPEPCRSCDNREIDWGGCRCQALALTGDAARTDPACALSADHAIMLAAIAETDNPAPAFVYRRIGGRPG